MLQRQTDRRPKHSDGGDSLMAQALIVRRGGGAYSGPPEFTYTGQYEFIDDGDGNWRLKFLTSGTFVLLRPSELQIDVFLVGGGGGAILAGGGGGYTATYRGFFLQKGIEYPIVVGARGLGSSNLDEATNGGNTTAFSYTANGGHATGYTNGGNGGSGGGGSASGPSDVKTYGGDGGSNGGNGVAGRKSGYDGYAGPGGTGQGTTTREFGEDTEDLYSGGGAGGAGKGAGTAGAGGGGKSGRGTPGSNATYYGGGGGGGYIGGGNGYQGIVIIRNARAGINTEVA